MKSLFAAVGAVLAAGFLPFTASAQQAEWRIVEAHGSVRVSQPGVAPADAHAPQSVVNGMTITTGANGRATVTNGVQRMVVTANSRMTIAPDSTDAMTRILQDLGAVLFQVDRRGEQHFRVETPLLAAVVKGTTFTVMAGGAEDVVHVTEGLVEVRALNGGAANDVAAGVSARVSRDAPSAVAVATPSPHASIAEGRATASFDYRAASGGVVANPVAAERAQGARGAEMSNGSASNALGPQADAFGHGMAALRATTVQANGNSNNGGAGNANNGGAGNANNGGAGNSNNGGAGNASNGGAGNSNNGGAGNANNGGAGNANNGGAGNANNGGAGNSNNGGAGNSNNGGAGNANVGVGVNLGGVGANVGVDISDSGVGVGLGLGVGRGNSP